MPPKYSKRVVFPCNSINLAIEGKMGYQLAQAKDGVKVQQNPSKSKGKYFAPQTRISIVGTNNVPAAIMMNQPAMQSEGNNFKTFYNMNSNSDYNYQIDFDRNAEQRNKSPPRHDII